MAKKAKLYGAFSRVLVGGDVVSFTNTDFLLYKEDGITLDPVNRDAGEYFDIVQNHSLLFIYLSGTRTIEMHFTRHINSQSIQDDIDGNHGNSSIEDLSASRTVHLIGSLIHPVGGIYEINELFVYTPAIHPPNIDIVRIANNLRNSYRDAYNVFTNATINALSLVKPAKVSPFSFGSLIKYAPNYMPVFVLPTQSGTIQLSEGQSFYAATTTVLTNVSENVTAIFVLGLNLGVTKNILSVYKEVYPGTHTFNNYCTILGADYSLGSLTYNILPAIQTIFEVSTSVNVPINRLILVLNNTGGGTRGLIPTIICKYSYGDSNEFIASTTKVNTGITIPVGQSTHNLLWVDPTVTPINFTRLDISYILKNTSGDTILSGSYIF